MITHFNFALFNKTIFHFFSILFVYDDQNWTQCSNCDPTKHRTIIFLGPYNSADIVWNCRVILAAVVHCCLVHHLWSPRMPRYFSKSNGWSQYNLSCSCVSDFFFLPKSTILHFLPLNCLLLIGLNIQVYLDPFEPSAWLLSFINSFNCVLSLDLMSALSIASFKSR